MTDPRRSEENPPRKEACCNWQKALDLYYSYKSPEQVATPAEYARLIRRPKVRKWKMALKILGVAALVGALLLWGPPLCGAADEPQDASKLKEWSASLRTLTDPSPSPSNDPFVNWANATVRTLSERFEVVPPAYLVETVAPSLDCTAAKTYDPVRQVIAVYRYAPNGDLFGLEMMRYQFYHGFLHHLHKVHGVNHLPGHDREFDRWMRVLGLVGNKR